MSSEKRYRPTLILFLSIFLAVAIPVSATWFYVVNAQKTTIHASLTESGNQVSSVLSVALAGPLWDYRQDKITAICDQFISNPNIKKILVRDTIMGVVVYDQGSDDKVGRITVSKKNQITSNSKIVGELTVELSSYTYDDRLYRQQMMLLALFIAELIVSFLLITYSVYHFILFPLHRKTETVISGGKVSKDEESFMSISVEKLSTRIVDILDELKNYHGIVNEHVVIVKLESRGFITHVTKALEELSGYSADELTGSPFSMLAVDSSHEKLMEQIEKLSSVKHTCYPLFCKGKDGNNFWLDCNITGEADGGYAVVCTNITDKKAVEKLANTDELTGLMNRRNINSQLKNLDNIYKRYGAEYSVLIIDIDHFKKINDTYGHQRGDDVLVLFAAVLSENIRETDMCARWGGEEFIIACPNTSVDKAKVLAENLVRVCEQADFGGVGSITCSVGVSGICEKCSMEDVLKRADDALYFAKGSGRNRVELI